MSHYKHVSPAEESVAIRAAGEAAAHAGELATARQMAALTGRSATNWLPPAAQGTAYPVACDGPGEAGDPPGCGWTGVSTALVEVEGAVYCPACGRELLY